MSKEKNKKRSGAISRRAFLRDSGVLVGGTTIGSSSLLIAQNGAKTAEAGTAGQTAGALAETIAADEFDCPLCMQEFNSLEELKVHLKSSHDETAAALNVVKLIVNRRLYEVQVKPNWTLYHVIHDVLGFTGVKASCERGACGFCTVIINGRPVLSCMTLAIDCDGTDIETIEKIAEENHPLLESWIKYDGMQCGFCTPGAIVTAKILLDRNPNPTEDEIRESLSGNLCRCVTYPAWTKAVLDAAGKGF